MLLSYKPRLMLAVLLASLALPPCWAIPTATPSPATTPPKPGSPVNPITPGAPVKAGKSATFQVATYLKSWMQSQQAKLAMAPYTKGGIEGWVQFEFEYAIKTAMKIPIQTTLREANVYEKSNLAADFVFQQDVAGSTVSTKGLIVELKVESSTQTGKKFADLVKRDQGKVGGGLKPDYQKFDTAVVAIAWNKDTQNLLSDINMLPNADLAIPVGGGRTLSLYEWSGEPAA